MPRKQNNCDNKESIRDSSQVVIGSAMVDEGSRDSVSGTESVLWGEWESCFCAGAIVVMTT